MIAPVQEALHKELMTLIIPVLYVVVYCEGDTVKTKAQSISSMIQDNEAKIHTLLFIFDKLWRYHLMVYLRLGWLTVLSSRNMVEHELYFRLTVPGWCWNSNTQTHTWVSTSAKRGSVKRGTVLRVTACLDGEPYMKCTLPVKMFGHIQKWLF